MQVKIFLNAIEIILILVYNIIILSKFMVKS